MIAVVVEPGVGKTCILRAVRHLVAAAGYRLTYSHNATLGAATSTASSASPSASRLLPPPATSSTPCRLHIEELARERVHPVFLIDEAHLLHQDTLDHLHIC